MKITRIADGAYFVPSYSEQTITRAFDLTCTVLSLGPSTEEETVEDKVVSLEPIEERKLLLLR